MNKSLVITFLLAGLFLTGCYNARVTTGLAPSAQTVEVAWAHSFLGGLVPPNVVNVAQQCSSGVASVETKLSFLNLVANAITFGLYSPMHITVTCAASSAEIPADAQRLAVEAGQEFNEQALQQLLTDAARLSAEHQAPVYLHLN
ncbi:MAG: Bor family protein [Candidatus Cyclonatronum sp.]|uniref:Bor family protein n=1 Tax=Cyclonatronum sp. TaxID=3024185 RepID=UPI0025BF827A|nr:Bor family protein [Cyclonatronum sp.]MCH8487952.1 Bor family protein [Cyclonatronum sp.]